MEEEALSMEDKWTTTVVVAPAPHPPSLLALPPAPSSPGQGVGHHLLLDIDRPWC